MTGRYSPGTNMFYFRSTWAACSTTNAFEDGRDNLRLYLQPCSTIEEFSDLVSWYAIVMGKYGVRFGRVWRNLVIVWLSIKKYISFHTFRLTHILSRSHARKKKYTEISSFSAYMRRFLYSHLWKIILVRSERSSLRTRNKYFI